MPGLDLRELLVQLPQLGRLGIHLAQRHLLDRAPRALERRHARLGTALGRQSLDEGVELRLHLGRLRAQLGKAECAATAE